MTVSVTNLTPHAINVCNSDNQVIKTFEPSKDYNTIRVIKETVYTNTRVNDVPLVKTIISIQESLATLPTRETDTVFLVSGMVLDFIKNHSKRTDFVAPDTNSAVRNDKGHIIGVYSFEVINRA